MIIWFILVNSFLRLFSFQSSQIFCQYNEISEEDRPHFLAPLGLRYFTPREISNLHYFPKDFGEFPGTPDECMASKIKRWRVEAIDYRINAVNLYYRNIQFVNFANMNITIVLAFFYFGYLSNLMELVYVISALYFHDSL